MATTFYVSEKNFYVGVGGKLFKQNVPFSRKDWTNARGKEASLDTHLARGYIKEWSQEIPEAVRRAAVQAPIEVEATVVDTPKADKPQGIWTVDPVVFEGKSLEELNAIYLAMAERWGIKARSYSNIDSLKEKMSSDI